uniref:Uncharacterized protein n=1 Tax=Magallana gigas TaxID=29159 RepID=K1QXC1_MAGGI
MQLDMEHQAEVTKKPSGGWKVWRIINLLLGVFFMLAALVNLNDSDWYLWMVVLLFEAIKGELKNPLEQEEGRPVHASNKQMMNALLLITVTLTFIPLLTWSLCYVGDWHTRLGHCKGMF